MVGLARGCNADWTVTYTSDDTLICVTVCLLIVEKKKKKPA